MKPDMAGQYDGHDDRKGMRTVWYLRDIILLTGDLE